MRIFTYRNKRAVRKTARILGCILLALALLVIGRVLYVQRYVTYTPDGVRLDYDQHLDYTGQEQLEPDPVDYPFETVLDAVAETDGEAEKQTRLDGYSISTTMLVNGVEQVLPIHLSDEEMAQLRTSADAIRAAIRLMDEPVE